MINKLKIIWVLTRNIIILFLILELLLCGIYTYKSKKSYDNFIALKVEANVHKNMSAEEVKEMYYEYNNLEMQWTSFTHFSYKSFNGKYNTIDSLGHRKTEQNANSNKNPIKIFCFGGSTMYGIGGRDNYTIPSLLSNIISKEKSNTNVSVINFGIIGYNRDQEALLLRKELLKGNIPDIVIFLDGVNDVASGFQNNDVGYIQNVRNRVLEFNTSKKYSEKINLLLKSSYTNRVIKYLQSKITRSQSKISTVDLPKKIAFNYRNHINYTNALSQKYKFKVFNFLQPTIFSKKETTDYENVMKENDIYLKDIFDNTYDVITKDSFLLKETSYFDISTIFDSNKDIMFTDFCHTTEKGNKILAKEIFNHIKSEINIQKSNTELLE